jgi:E1A-binding protein p400
MAKMLDVLEVFLNIHGHTYMRLDGSTKPETRQVGGGRRDSGGRAV